MDQIGLYLSSRSAGRAPARSLAATAVEAERAGFGALWLGESTGREALTAAAFLLSATTTLKVGTAVATLVGRDPTAMFNGARTLSEGWGDRFILGIGSSHPPMVKARGHEPLRLVDTEAYLRALRNAPWTGPHIGAQPPVLLGTNGPLGLALARRCADGAITHFGTVAHTTQARTTLGHAARLVVLLPVCVHHVDLVPACVSQFVAGRLANASYGRAAVRLGLPVGDPAAVEAATVATGSVEDVAAGALAHLRAGADHVILWPLDAEPEEMDLSKLALVAAHVAASGTPTRTTAIRVDER